MFILYCCFAYEAYEVDESKVEEETRPISFVCGWLPNNNNNNNLGASEEELNQTLTQQNLPRLSKISEFMFPSGAKSNFHTRSRFPSSISFHFILTSTSGERAYGFCLRSLNRNNREKKNSVYNPRMDVGGLSLVETHCIITRYPLFQLFTHSLEIIRVRSILSVVDSSSNNNAVWSFLNALYVQTNNNNFEIENISSGGISCKYLFPQKNNDDSFPLNVLFETMNPEMIHFVIGSILLERRVLLVGRNEQILSYTSAALLSLIPFHLLKCSFPHVLVPILPTTFLEHGVAAPSPYLVGVLRSHLKVIDEFPQLGDLVIVDLDKRVVRLSPGASPIIPIGLNETNNNTVSSSSSSLENPWKEVCDYFSKDVRNSFSSKDVGLLVSCFRVVVLLIAFGRPNQMEDVLIRNFAGLFRKTQLYSMIDRKKTEQMYSLLGERGYNAVKIMTVGEEVKSTQGERIKYDEARLIVEGLTSSSNNNGCQPNVLNDLAKRSFDCIQAQAMESVLNQRLNDSAGRSWRHGFQALEIIEYLSKTGSEFLLSKMWDLLSLVFLLTRFVSGNVVGVTSKTCELIRVRATKVYYLLINLNQLGWCRSINGHVILRTNSQKKTFNSVSRLGFMKQSIEEVLSLIQPPSLLISSPSPKQQQQQTPKRSPTNSNKPIVIPPPPPRVSTNNNNNNNNNASSNPFEDSVLLKSLGVLEQEEEKNLPIKEDEVEMPSFLMEEKKPIMRPPPPPPPAAAALSSLTTNSNEEVLFIPPSSPSLSFLSETKAPPPPGMKKKT